MSARPEQNSTADELPLRRFLTYRLNRLQARLNAQATQYLARHAGITLSEWRAIALVGGPGETTLTEACRHAQLDKGLLSRTLKALAGRGLVQARQDDRDQRVQHLSLTKKGRTVFEHMLPRMRARQRFLREALTPMEFATLHAAIDKLEIAAEETEFDL